MNKDPLEQSIEEIDMSEGHGDLSDIKADAEDIKTGPNQHFAPGTTPKKKAVKKKVVKQQPVKKAVKKKAARPKPTAADSSSPAGAPKKKKVKKKAVSRPARSTQREERKPRQDPGQETVSMRRTEKKKNNLPLIVIGVSILVMVGAALMIILKPDRPVETTYESSFTKYQKKYNDSLNAANQEFAAWKSMDDSTDQGRRAKCDAAIALKSKYVAIRDLINDCYEAVESEGIMNKTLARDIEDWNEEPGQKRRELGEYLRKYN